MAYGHAERTLATIRQLEAETRELLLGLDQLDPEQAQWLADIAQTGARRLALEMERRCERAAELHRAAEG
jgi:hypothetical protein